MRHKYLWISMMILVLFSCRKERHTDTGLPHQNPPNPPASAVLVKEIIVPNLPSPYYHFEYDQDGKYSFASFASDFTRYTFKYKDDRLNEMQNNIIVNKDRLLYTYDNADRVTTIIYIDSTGIIYKKVFFTYDAQKLIKVEWANQHLVSERTLAFTYYPDGNLFEITDHRLPVNGVDDNTFIDRYENYDNKLNTGDFMLLHDGFHDHLFLLPGVKLQKNNPGRQTRTGDGFHFKADYTYTYNDRNAPVTQNGVVEIQTGSNAGQIFHTTTNYTYY